MNSTRIDVRQVQNPESRNIYDVVFELRFDHARAQEILTRTTFLPEMVSIIRNIASSCFEAALEYIQEAPPNYVQHLPPYKRCGTVYAGHECVICTENLQSREYYRKLPCEHVFHKRCIDRWITRQPTCPTCRASILQPTTTTPTVTEEEEEIVG